MGVASNSCSRGMKRQAILQVPRKNVEVCATDEGVGEVREGVGVIRED